MLRMFSRGLLLISLLKGVGNSVPVPVLDLKSLVANSPVIAVGEITNIREVARKQMVIRGHEMSVTEMEARMRVDRLIKGNAPPGLAFHFLLPEFGMGYHGVPAHSYRVVFLKQEGNRFEIADPYYPSLPAVPSSSGDDGPALESILNELSAVLESRNTSSNDKEVAVWTLRTVNNTRSTEALRRAVSTEEGTIKLNAVAALLARNDLAALPIAEQVLDAPLGSVRDDVYQNLASAIEVGVSNPQAIPVLIDLLRNQHVRVRRAAAFALHNTKSQLAIKGLVAALSDSDVEVRYYAVIGLAEITDHNDWRPLEEQFRSDEAKYLTYWKNWRVNRPT